MRQSSTVRRDIRIGLTNLLLRRRRTESESVGFLRAPETRPQIDECTTHDEQH
jgi:hypothetical protein